MKKILIVFAVLLGFATIALAAPNLLGTRKVTDNVVKTTWAHNKSTPTGLINATGATAAYGTGEYCNEGSVVFEIVTGSNIMNVAMQVAYDYSSPGDIATTFYNSIGTDAAPYHQVNAADTDTLKFDFSGRGFNKWRLNCLTGCGVNNTISKVYGYCWESND